MKPQNQRTIADLLDIAKYEEDVLTGEQVEVKIREVMFGLI